MTLILCVILVALIFEYINGFHDTANSIATVVATKVMTPRQAVAMAAICNLGGALMGSAVASTIGKGLVDIDYVTSATILCGLLSGIIWNLITWYYGIPSSSSHALIGGLVGSTLAAAHGNWDVIYFTEKGGLLQKVVIPMLVSPICGIVMGFVIMGFLYYLLRKWRPHTVKKVFGNLQIFSAAGMGVAHGLNDAQKTMGIIALTLVAGTKAGALDQVPNFMDFLVTPEPAAGAKLEVAMWIKVTCALTMAAGTWAGGWKIIKTLGHKMVRLQPVHGFAAETTAATVIGVASFAGIPLSTTHVISSAIMGVGASKRLNAVKWSVVERMVWAWVFTLPVTGILGYLMVRFGIMMGWMQ
ncbi:MAG: inorganic phosphate transporter [Verrucomicrobia bacterium]|jgi:PiT family inorganic phosphate transporter|nr:inorganic phosphate transporter [Verrucomicrobiota bacterium]